MRKKYLPLVAFSIYIVFTLIVAFWGPLTYIGLDAVNVIGYMFLFLVLFAVGYYLGVNGFKSRVLHDSVLVEKQIFRLLKFSILMAVFYKFQEFAVLAVTGKLNLSLANAGENYVELYADYERGTGGYDIGWVIGIFFYLPLLISMILGVYYYKKLPPMYRFFVISIFVFIFIVNTLGQGKQKQIGDMLVFLLSILVIKLGSDSNSTDIKKRQRTKRVYFWGLLVGLVGLFGFISILSARYAALGIDVSNIQDLSHPLIIYDIHHPVFQIFGNDIGFGIAVFSGYLAQGYLGLSLAFNEPFVWTYGIGNSYATTILFGKVFGLPVSVEDSYPFRVGADTGWGLAKWHSVFPWLASDFTFPGVLIIFFFYAFVYGRCWREATVYKNPLSILLFCILNLGLVFVPSNNQLLHTPESVLALFLIACMWINTRWKYNCK